MKKPKETPNPLLKALNWVTQGTLSLPRAVGIRFDGATPPRLTIKCMECLAVKEESVLEGSREINRALTALSIGGIKTDSDAADTIPETE